MLSCVTKLEEIVAATEHGRLARRDGTVVGESFQTRLMTQG